MIPYIVETNSLYKSFRLGFQDTNILSGINIQIPSGDFRVIFGPSGAGKSTLLHTILGLEKPTSGKVFIMGKDIYSLGGDDEISEFRRTHIGMIYQQPNWIKALSVVENVAFPLSFLGIPKSDTLRMAWQQLMKIKLDSWVSHFPAQLSSGQQQKAALARALVTNPTIIVADEPTGNLDNASGIELMEILRDLNQRENKTIIMVTHDLEYLRFAKSATQILDGRVQAEYDSAGLQQLAQTLPSRKVLHA